MSKHPLRPILMTLALASAIAASGCATLMGGGPSDLDVNVTEPRRDVEVRIENLATGETIIQRQPEFTVTLSRAADYQVTVRSPLYTTREIHIGRSIRPVFWLNVLNLGLGMIVDAATSQMWQHGPQKVDVRLERARRGANGEWVLPIVVSSGLGREVIEAPIIR